MSVLIFQHITYSNFQRNAVHSRCLFIAGVTPIELRALDPELPVGGGRGAPVAVAELPQHLLVAEHAVHTCGVRGQGQLRHGQGNTALGNTEQMHCSQKTRNLAERSANDRASTIP